MLTGMAKASHAKNSIAHRKESMIELVKEYNNIAGAKPITAEELKDEQGNSTLSLPGTFETDLQLSVAYGNILEYSLHEDYYNPSR